MVSAAVGGTSRCLKAAIKKGAAIKRVVVVSSVAAVRDTQIEGKVYTGDDWTDEEKASGYQKSKTLAERKAWELQKEAKFEMATVNPAVIIGPILGKLHLKAEVTNAVRKAL